MPWKEYRLWSQLDLGSTPSLGNLVGDRDGFCSLFLGGWDFSSVLRLPIAPTLQAG